MRLFHCVGHVSTSTQQTQPIVNTPLGGVLFRAKIGTINTEEIHASETVALTNSTRVFIWNAPDFDVELLISQLPFDEVRKYGMEGCYTALWRIRAISYLPSLSLVAEWKGEHRWIEGGTDTDEYFYAWTWGDSATDVTIGTEDMDLLEMRALQDRQVPQSWSSLLNGSSLSPYASTQDGLAIRLPPLKAPEQCEISFGVGWGKSRQGFASNVERFLEPAEILKHVGCS